MQVAAATAQGTKHAINEDSHEALETADGGALVLLCDGMGGMGHGDRASQLAIETIRKHVTGPDFDGDIVGALKKADQEVCEQLCVDGKQPGTTAAALYVANGCAHVAWVGDSRVYLFRGHEVVRRTTDHRIVAEMVEAGVMTPEEAKASSMSNVLSRSLGARLPDDVVEVAKLDPAKIRRGDRLVLCSDGLHEHVSEDTIVTMMDQNQLAEAAKKMVDLARERGASDDVTVVVVECSEGDTLGDDTLRSIGRRWNPDNYPTEVVERGTLGLPEPSSAEAVPMLPLVVGGVVAVGLVASGLVAVAYALLF